MDLICGLEEPAKRDDYARMLFRAQCALAISHSIQTQIPEIWSFNQDPLKLLQMSEDMQWFPLMTLMKDRGLSVRTCLVLAEMIAVMLKSRL